jgi:hypothetical protein
LIIIDSYLALKPSCNAILVNIYFDGGGGGGGGGVGGGGSGGGGGGGGGVKAKIIPVITRTTRTISRSVKKYFNNI